MAVSEITVSLILEASGNGPAVWPGSPLHVAKLSAQCPLTMRKVYSHTRHIESICYNGYKCGPADIG